MVDVINTLKANARILHRQAAAGDRNALARVRRNYAPALKKDAESSLQRSHCLTVLTREMGFSGWKHALDVINGTRDDDFGVLLCPPRCNVHTNVWLASYDEARRAQADNGGYLLAYKSQYLVVDADYIRTLGLDPNDADWTKIRRDWVRPGDIDSRGRLYAKLAQITVPFTGPFTGEMGEAS